MNAYHNFAKDKIALRRYDQETDRENFKKFCAAWVRDYLQAGDKCDGSAVLSGRAFTKRHDISIAYLEQKAVGLLVLKNLGAGRFIEIAYVDKSHRRRGIATQLYKFAMESCDAQEIMLTYKRVLSRVSYWQGLGYRSLRGFENEGYKERSGCFLSTKEHLYSICAVPLTEDAVVRYMAGLGSTYDFKSPCLTGGNKDPLLPCLQNVMPWRDKKEASQNLYHCPGGSHFRVNISIPPL